MSGITKSNSASPRSDGFFHGISCSLSISLKMCSSVALRDRSGPKPRAAWEEGVEG